MKKYLGLVIVLIIVATFATCLYGCNFSDNEVPSKIVITFETNGGSAVPQMTVEAEGTFKFPKDPTKEGYDFEGWYLDEATTKAWKSGDNIPESITVYAKWKEKIKYAITFLAGEGATGTAPTMESQYEGANITLPANTFTKTNFVFVGWTDGTTTRQAGASYAMTAAAVTFTAVWSEEEESPPTNVVAESITQSAVTIYTTGNRITLGAENFILPANTTFVSATCSTDIIDAGNYTVSVVVNANIHYTINGKATHRFDNVNVVVTQAAPAESDFGKVIGHEDAQKADLLALNASQITSIKEDLRIAYFHTSHGNQVIEGNYAINYLFRNDASYDPDSGNERPKDFSDAIVFDSYGENLYVDAGQKDSAIEDLGTDIGSLVTATKSFFGDAGQNGDLLFEAGKDLDVNVVIWSWCGELAVFSEARVQQYLDDLNELENYYNGVNNPKKIVFVYMTGHLYNSAYYPHRTDDTKENNTRNNALIREYCKQNNKILFDFEDIESYNPDGEYFGDVCDDTSLYWNGGVAERWARDWEADKTENVDWVALNTLRNSGSAQSFDGFKPITVTNFSHAEYSIIVLSKAYAFWMLLNHLTTVV